MRLCGKYVIACAVLAAVFGCSEPQAITLKWPAVRRTQRDRYANKGLKERIRKLEFPLDGYGAVQFSEAILFFHDVSGLDFYANWHALKQAGVVETTTVKVRLQNVSVREALMACLKHVSRAEPLGYEIADGVVIVSTVKDAGRLARLINTPPKTGDTDADLALAERTARFVASDEYMAAEPLFGRKDDFNLVLDDIEMDDTIQYIRNLSGVDIHVDWQSMHDVGLGYFALRARDGTSPPAAKARVRLGKVAFHTALIRILDSAAKGKSLTYKIEGGKVHIFAPKQP